MHGISGAGSETRARLIRQDVRVSEEWFRRPEWDEVARNDFERRLRRARAGNRPQYLRIKGLALRDAGNPDGARHLWTRVLDEFPDSLHASSALEHLGDLARQEHQADEAERHYRTLLARNPTLNGTTHMVEVSLAEILIEHDDDVSHREALQLLQSRATRRSSMFNDQVFRWHVARAALSLQVGDIESLRYAARKALALTQLGPQLPRHPTLGLARADQHTLNWLRTCATGTQTSTLGRQPPWGQPPADPARRD
jgi:tetratricopeptide (TPR) repeat protein